MIKQNIKSWFLTGALGSLLICCLTFPLLAQDKVLPKKDTPVKTAPGRLSSDKILIDSLETELESLKIKFNTTDSLYEAERFESADLRDRMIKLDDYRKKLENNVGSYKGENLKLNQSNRILIVFNSLVAVLLVVSLVFFLKKIGSKKNKDSDTDSEKTFSTQGDKKPLLSLEDKLQQLERLGKLREKGLLSENEFLGEKQKILGK